MGLLKAVVLQHYRFIWLAFLFFLVHTIFFLGLSIGFASFSMYNYFAVGNLVFGFNSCTDKG